MRLFVAVAECRSFSMAAQRLGLSQPAVSQRVAGLEGDLGVKLLDRATRPPVLTPAGRRYLEGCRALLDDAERLERAVQVVHRQSAGAAGGRAAPIRLASIYSGGMEWLNAARAAFADASPEAPSIEVGFGSPSEVEAAVREGDADLALVSFPDGIDRSSFDWDAELLRDEPMALVAPAGHPVAREPHVRARHLKGVELIGFDPALRVGRATVAYLRRNGVDAPLTHHFDNMDTLRAAVSATGHCAILPLPLVVDELAGGRLVAVELTPPLSRPLGLVAAAGTLDRADVRRWVDHLRDTPATARSGAPVLAGSAT